MGTICGKCHRPLTDPKSVELGFGPECWASINGGGPTPTGAARSDYDYHLSGDDAEPIVVVTDLNKGRMSVTNNIEAIFGEICGEEGLPLQGTELIYRDSDGIYDAAYAEADGTVHIYALHHLVRPKSEEEAILAMQEARRATSDDTLDH